MKKIRKGLAVYMALCIVLMMTTTSVFATSTPFVGAQSGTITQGTTQSAIFAVSTDAADGEAVTIDWYSDAGGTIGDTTPAGITADASLVSTSSSSITLSSDGSTMADSYYFKVTIDSVQSDVVTLTVEAPDVTAPVLSAVSVSGATYSGATLNFTSDEAGTYYYLVYDAGAAAPDAATIKAQGTAVAKDTGSASAAANAEAVSGLTAATNYMAYVIVEDASNNSSLVSSAAFTTTSAPDVTAPVLSAVSVSGATYSGATLNFTSDEAGTYYYLVYDAGAASPDAATIKAQGTAVAKATGVATAAANAEVVSGLTAATNYMAYVIVEDASNNSSLVSSAGFTTTSAPDVTAPVLSAVSVSGATYSGATLNFTSDEAGTYYYLVYDAGVTAPDATTIKAQGTAVAKATGSASAAANAKAVSGLIAATNYMAYVIVEDASNNPSLVASAAFTTTAAPDVTAPVLGYATASEITTSTAAIIFKSYEAGTYYYLVYDAGAAAPDAATVKAQGTAVAKSTGTAIAAVNTTTASGLTAFTDYKAYIIVVDAAGNTSLVSTVAFRTANLPYTLAIASETAGGAGYTRTVTIGGSNANDLTGKYLVVQFAEGTGVNAKVTVIMISPESTDVNVSYQTTGTTVNAWLMSGMPELTRQDMGVTTYAHAATNQ